MAKSLILQYYSIQVYLNKLASKYNNHNYAKRIDEFPTFQPETQVIKGRGYKKRRVKKKNQKAAAKTKEKANKAKWHERLDKSAGKNTDHKKLKTIAYDEVSEA